MTTITSTKTISNTGMTFGLFNAIETYFANRAVYNKTVRELSRLSERELEDLGLNRADIHGVARQSVAMR